MNYHKKNTETALFLILLSLIFVFYFKKIEIAYFTTVFVLLLILSPNIYYYPSLILNGFTKFIHFIMSNLLLTFVFFLFIVPISFFRKIFSLKHDFKLTQIGNSNYKTITNKIDEDFFKRTF
jgi:hypothetical protein